MRKFATSAGHALRGLRFVWKEEQNFRIQLLCATGVVLFMIFWKFTYVEMGFILFAIALVLTAEVINTIVEDALNLVEPNHHPTVGKLKDMMAGIVLVTSVLALVIGVLTGLHHFSQIVP